MSLSNLSKVDENDKNELLIMKRKFEDNESSIIHELYNTHFKGNVHAIGEEIHLDEHPTIIQEIGSLNHSDRSNSGLLKSGLSPLQHYLCGEVHPKESNMDISPNLRQKNDSGNDATEEKMRVQQILV